MWKLVSLIPYMLKWCLEKQTSNTLKNISHYVFNWDYFTFNCDLGETVPVDIHLLNRARNSTRARSEIWSTAWKLSVFGVFLVRVQSECGELRIRQTPNTGHAMVNVLWTYFTICFSAFTVDFGCLSDNFISLFCFFSMRHVALQ